MEPIFPVFLDFPPPFLFERIERASESLTQQAKRASVPCSQSCIFPPFSSFPLVPCVFVLCALLSISLSDGITLNG